MAAVTTIPLTYQSSLEKFAAKIAAHPHTIWLDSSHPYSSQGRYEILVTAPDLVIKIRQNQLQTQNSSGTIQTHAGNPFTLLQQILLTYPQIQDSTRIFCGGFVGYFGYDLARCCEELPDYHPPLANFDDGYGGIYTWGIVTDHQLQTTEIIGILPIDTLQSQVEQWLNQPSQLLPAFELLHPPTPEITYATYSQAFAAIKNYILSGDCYQINLSQRFYAPFQGHPWNAYQILRQINPTPFAAYINHGDYQILSCSPERFLKIQEQQVMSQPIKGTMKRDPNTEHDIALRQALLASPKNHAENIMIVDLIRNDISRNCEPGTVKVPNLCALESFNQVHHLVSTIIGKLADTKTALDCLRDCFPGGSVTGVPKIRAMEIIEEVETSRRGIYCGSIGYCSFNGNLDTNIAIRTLWCENQHLTLSAGGAIVADSDCHAEYTECFTKIQAICQALQT